MNKKLVYASIAVSLVGGFWACGEGDVINYDANLEGLAEALVVDVSEKDVPTAMAACNENPECVEAMMNSTNVTYPSSTISESSSNDHILSSSNDVEKSSSSQVIPSSSSQLIIVPQTSSSITVVDYSSDSNPIQSSSVEITNPGDGSVGTCAPLENPINRGASTTWKYTKSASVQNAAVLKAQFDWAFEDGSITESKKTGNLSSDPVTYEKSGPKNATLVLTLGGSEPVAIPCAPLNVNGADITGCKCTAVNDKPDVAAAESATWAISGCTSVANIISYTWTGATADVTGLTAEAPVAKKGDIAKASVTVANDDNMQKVVECPAITAIDASLPDYELGFEGDQIDNKTRVDIPFNKEACIQVKFNWTNAGWTPNNISVLCDVAPKQGSPGLKLDITYNSQKKSYSGDYNISNSGIALGPVKAGQNIMDNVCVTVTGTDGGTASCFLGN